MKGGGLGLRQRTEGDEGEAVARSVGVRWWWAQVQEGLLGGWEDDQGKRIGGIENWDLTTANTGIRALQTQSLRLKERYFPPQPSPNRAK